MAEVENLPLKIWAEKYRFTNGDTGLSFEYCPADSKKRVVDALFVNDPDKQAYAECLELVQADIVCPAGRINAGAGTGRKVTLFNCFTSPVIEDDMGSIMDALKVAAMTQKQGGGIGMDFSKLRSHKALVRGAGQKASGPLSFMDMWHWMCMTVMSAGSRRGAMMGGLRIDHPDIRDFIHAKAKEGRLTNFNVSVLVTDEFMACLRKGGDFALRHEQPPADNPKADKHPEGGYVYEWVKAADLWDEILQATYEYAEPGVLFLDRANKENNLSYCEEMFITNPCGEQWLPPNNNCNLIALNLAKMVDDPFSAQPWFNVSLLSRAVRAAVRLGDNVIDVSNYPTEDQRVEGLRTRRIGVGIMGLGNMLQQMKMVYGSQVALEFTEKVMENIANEAYRVSAELAKERGSFPDYNEKEFLKAPFVWDKLHSRVFDIIKKNGIRNGVLLTVAPTGTISIYAGNVSGGLEPSFSFHYERDVILPEGKKTFVVEDYGYAKYREFLGLEPGAKFDLPDYMVTAMQLPVEAHVNMLAAVQKYIDASVSKTINCPADMPYEDFKAVYQQAYDLGCKGCTTYRPSGVRGSVLREVKEEPTEEKVDMEELLEEDKRILERYLKDNKYVAPKRPAALRGVTYKLKWPHHDENTYLTINDGEDGQPYEIFLASKAAGHGEANTVMTRLASMVLRNGEALKLAEELEGISSNQVMWQDGVCIPSFPALVGRTLRQHIEESQSAERLGQRIVAGLQDGSVEIVEKDGYSYDDLKDDAKERTSEPEFKKWVDKGLRIGALKAGIPPNDVSIAALGATHCPKCTLAAYVHESGCGVCKACGYSACG